MKKTAVALLCALAASPLVCVVTVEATSSWWAAATQVLPPRFRQLSRAKRASSSKLEA